MTTVETAKTIRAELKATFPTYKFSVRKEHYGVLNIAYNGDKAIRNAVDSIARKYEDVTEYQTQYVFVNAYGTN